MNESEIYVDPDDGISSGHSKRASTDAEADIVRHLRGGVFQVNEASDVFYRTSLDRAKARQKFASKTYQLFDSIYAKASVQVEIPAVRVYEDLSRLCLEEAVPCPSLRTIQTWVRGQRDQSVRTKNMLSNRPGRSASDSH